VHVFEDIVVFLLLCNAEAVTYTRDRTPTEPAILNIVSQRRGTNLLCVKNSIIGVSVLVSFLWSATARAN
jgi:hypothetical protein